MIFMPAYKNNLEVQIKQDFKQNMGLIDHEQSDTFHVWKFRGGSTNIYEESIISSYGRFDLLRDQ